VSAAQGQATFKAEADNSSFPSLLVSVPTGYSFTDLELSTSGNEALNFSASNGSSYSISDLGSGLNQFLIVATGGTAFTSLLLTAPGSGFSQIKNIEISGLAAVPAPIVGGGLPGWLASVVGLVALARRRRSLLG
jgi:hypothetical protein